MRSRLALAVLLALLMPGSSSAQQNPRDRVPFAVSPVGFSKGFFRFNTSPGEKRTEALRVTNLTDREIEVEIRPVDVGTATSGGLDYGEGAPKGDGRWLTVGTPEITLGPRSRRDVPITLEVPADAQGGEHYAGVVALDPAAVRESKTPQPGAGAVNLRFLSRLAVPALIRLPGPTEAALEVSDPKIVSNPSGSYVSIDLTNTGNVRIPTTTGRLTVEQGGRVVIDQSVSLESFVPRTTISLPLPFTGRPVRDDYRITGILRPEGAENVDVDLSISFGDDEAEDLEAATGQAPEGGGGGVPVWVWILIALLAIGLLAALLRRRPAGGDIATDPPDRSRDATGPAVVPSHHEPIDINTAGVEDLQQLPGVGPAAAGRIVAHREEYGRFSSIDELSNVEGFDADRIAGLGDAARV